MESILTSGGITQVKVRQENNENSLLKEAATQRQRRKPNKKRVFSKSWGESRSDLLSDHVAVSKRPCGG
ncbi:MAG: hypothetical protein KAW49_05695 [Anaerolineae bacterium]|nr:hypothetical protein [Anaerolineae bacterium]